MNTFLSSLYRTLTVLLLGTGLLAVSGPTVLGQNSDDAPPSLVEHLRTELEHNSSIRRHLALIDVTGLANCPNVCQMNLSSAKNQELKTTKRLDLSALTPVLLQNYRRGPEDGQRLLALSALIGIGDEEAISTLVDEGARQSDNVNRETQRSLAAFYLGKYPELANKAKWNGEISLVDVEKAKRVRIKKARSQQ